MPNHVTTRCVVTGADENIKQFRDKAFLIKEKIMTFDFNAFIPMPQALAETESGTTAAEGSILLSLSHGRAPPQSQHHHGPAPKLNYATVGRMREILDMKHQPVAELAKAWLEENPEYRIEGEKRLRALAETGFADWYDWSCRHWNTKWNAYGLHIVSESPLEFTFDTAWDFPLPVFRKIAQEFPALSFRCDCYDEGGCFAGHGFFNPPKGKTEFATCTATDELYERVYGHPPENDD
jgi:hypothetical protein